MDVSISHDPWAPEPLSMTSAEAGLRYPHLKETDMAEFPRQRFLQAGASDQEADALAGQHAKLPALAQEQKLERLAGADVAELQRQIAALRAQDQQAPEPKPAPEPAAPTPEPEPVAAPEPEPEPAAVVLDEAEQLVAKIEAEKAQTAADEAKLAEGFEAKANL